MWQDRCLIDMPFFSFSCQLSSTWMMKSTLTYNTIISNIYHSVKADSSLIWRLAENWRLQLCVVRPTDDVGFGLRLLLFERSKIKVTSVLLLRSFYFMLCFTVFFGSQRVIDVRSSCVFLTLRCCCCWYHTLSLNVKSSLITMESS